MPKKLHQALEAQARQQGLSGADADRYVYGALKQYERRKKHHSPSRAKIGHRGGRGGRRG